MLRTVTSNSGVVRAANLLIELFGTSAAEFASKRAKRSLDAENLDSATAWLRVFAAIEEQTGDWRNKRSNAWR